MPPWSQQVEARLEVGHGPVAPRIQSGVEVRPSLHHESGAGRQPRRRHRGVALCALPDRLHSRRLHPARGPAHHRDNFREAGQNRNERQNPGPVQLLRARKAVAVHVLVRSREGSMVRGRRRGSGSVDGGEVRPCLGAAHRSEKPARNSRNSCLSEPLWGFGVAPGRRRWCSGRSRGYGLPRRDGREQHQRHSQQGGSARGEAPRPRRRRSLRIGWGGRGGGAAAGQGRQEEA
mmetsp:Transcript_132709/g.295891  ORF Transcript_132709/g.295891 Transcript_132709/m.295891 type:complete len:233 (+) Transcript_132709:125-823(+)